MRDSIAALIYSLVSIVLFPVSLIEQQTLGQEAEGKRAWGGFAVAEVE